MASLAGNGPAARAPCAQCGVIEGCLPIGLDPGARALLAGLIAPPHKIPRGGYAFRAGAEMQWLAMIRRGTLKSAVVDEQGREQVVGFHQAGELLGLDGIATKRFSRDAVALEDSEVCRIAYPELQKLSNEVPEVGHYIHRAMSREISRGYGVMLLLGSMRAETRLAFFLLDLSRRALARGNSPTELALPMTRKEIGGYLGLKLESVSRLFSAFDRDGMIAVRGKSVRLLDCERLEAMGKDAHPSLAAFLAGGDATAGPARVTP